MSDTIEESSLNAPKSSRVFIYDASRHPQQHGCRIELRLTTEISASNIVVGYKHFERT